MRTVRQEYGFQTRQSVHEGAGSDSWEELIPCVGRLCLCQGGSPGPGAGSKAWYRHLLLGADLLVAGDGRDGQVARPRVMGQVSPQGLKSQPLSCPQGRL